MSEQRHQFKAEIQQLLHILVHSLYTDREIFMRELISNAVDALNRLQFEMLTNRDVLDPDAELAVRIAVDEEAKTITVSDSGIGMTRDEIVQNLGTIAQSGAAAFIQSVQRARESEGDAQPAVEMIGQFGVGFYSAFMVANEVRVVSRSYLPNAEACEWISDGSDSFRVGPAEKAERGTDVIVHLNEDGSEFASEWRIEQIVKKHSDFVSFPIYIGDRIVNRQKPLWRQSPREVEGGYNDFYRYLTHDFEDPLLASHLVADVPVDIRSILYVPRQRDRGPLAFRTDYGLRLYARGVMIQENNKELLPNYLRFVEGVVESEDLPLNVSRETVQRNPAVRRIQRALVGKLISELGDMAAEKADDFRQFWREFGIFLKEGVASDPTAKDDLLPLLRFHSSRTEEKDGLVSLQEYAERMADDQLAIYYHLGDDLDAIVQSPHLDYFRAHDLEVLYMVDPIDSFMVLALNEYDGKPLKNIDDATLELPKREEEVAGPTAMADAEFDKLVGRFVDVLGDRVTAVRESRVLRDNPCRLVSPEGMPGQEMQRVYKFLNREYTVPKKALEINRRHPLIRNLGRLVSQSPQDPVINMAIEQLYENQLLVEGLHPNPASMIGRVQALMEEATGAGRQRSEEAE